MKRICYQARGTPKRNGISWTKPARPERIEPCCVERSNPRADTSACGARTADRAKRHMRCFASRPRSVSQPLAGFDSRVRKPRPRFPTAGGVLLLMRRNSSAAVALGSRTRRGFSFTDTRLGSRTPPQAAIPLLGWRGSALRMDVSATGPPMPHSSAIGTSGGSPMTARRTGGSIRRG